MPGGPLWAWPCPVHRLSGGGACNTSGSNVFARGCLWCSGLRPRLHDPQLAVGDAALHVLCRAKGSFQEAAHRRQALRKLPSCVDRACAHWGDCSVWRNDNRLWLGRPCSGGGGGAPSRAAARAALPVGCHTPAGGPGLTPAGVGTLARLPAAAAKPSTHAPDSACVL